MVAEEKNPADRLSAASTSEIWYLEAKTEKKTVPEAPSGLSLMLVKVTPANRGSLASLVKISESLTRINSFFRSLGILAI